MNICVHENDLVMNNKHRPGTKLFLFFQEAAQDDGRQSYSVLFILTDGQMNSIEATKIAMINASETPLSIVILGIGDNDFTNCEELDDFSISDSSVRDICHFVSYRKHKYDTDGLTRSIFSEIPEQLVDYFYSNKIMPLPFSGEDELPFDADDFKPSKGGSAGKFKLEFSRGGEVSELQPNFSSVSTPSLNIIDNLIRVACGDWT